MIRSLKKLAIEGMNLNIIKAIYDKSRANIILNGEKIKAYFLRSGQDEVNYFFIPSIHHCTGSPSRAIRKEKEMRRLNWKGRCKTVSVCR